MVHLGFDIRVHRSLLERISTDGSRFSSSGVHAFFPALSPLFRSYAGERQETKEGQVKITVLNMVLLSIIISAIFRHSL